MVVSPPTGKKNSSSTIPLVAYSSVRPFVEVLEMNGRDANIVLHSVGLPALAYGNDLRIPVQAWYDLAEAVASELRDFHAGFKTGYRQSIASMAHGSKLKFDGASLGEILNALVVDFSRVGNYSVYRLLSDGKWASIEARRTFRPSSRPVQIDAFSIGHMVQLVARFTGKSWNANQFRASISDPDAVPSSVLPQSSLSRASTKGVTVRFPAHWLLFCEGGALRQEWSEVSKVQNGFLSEARQVLTLHLSEPDLTLDKLAKYVSVSQSELRRSFAKNGGSFRAELNAVRFERAKELLCDSALQINAIGTEVGYLNDSSFARAFKQWAGQTPGEVRRSETLANKN